MIRDSLRDHTLNRTGRGVVILGGAGFGLCSVTIHLQQTAAVVIGLILIDLPVDVAITHGLVLLSLAVTLIHNLIVNEAVNCTGLCLNHHLSIANGIIGGGRGLAELALGLIALSVQTA